MSINKNQKSTPPLKDEQGSPKFVVYLRFPFSRNGFQDPETNQWNESKAHELREYLSTTTLKRGELDWTYLANKFQVSEPFILQQAIWLYERELEHVRDQMQRVNRHVSINRSQEKFKTSFRSIFPLPKQDFSESWITPNEGPLESQDLYQNTHNHIDQRKLVGESSQSSKLSELTLDFNGKHLNTDDYYIHSLRNRVNRDNQLNLNNSNTISQNHEKKETIPKEQYDQKQELRNSKDANSSSIPTNTLTRRLSFSRGFKNPMVYELDADDIGNEELIEEKTIDDSKTSDEFGEDDYDAFLACNIDDSTSK